MTECPLLFLCHPFRVPAYHHNKQGFHPCLCSVTPSGFPPIYTLSRGFTTACGLITPSGFPPHINTISMVKPLLTVRQQTKPRRGDRMPAAVLCHPLRVPVPCQHSKQGLHHCLCSVAPTGLSAYQHAKQGLHHCLCSVTPSGLLPINMLSRGFTTACALSPLQGFLLQNGLLGL